MSKDRTIEYILIVIINVFFAFYTNVFLGGIPYISLQIVSETTYRAIGGWFLYGALFYIVLKRNNIHAKSMFRLALGAVAVGLLTLFSKMALDYLTTELIADRISLIATTTIEGIVYDIYGIGLTAFLFIAFVKGNRQWSERSGKPFKWIMADIIIYIIGLVWIFTNKASMLEQIGTSEENIWRVDFYYASAVLPLNVWTYTFLMIFFWWLMRTLYSEEEKQLAGEEKNE